MQHMITSKLRVGKIKRENEEGNLITYEYFDVQIPLRISDRMELKKAETVHWEGNGDVKKTGNKRLVMGIGFKDVD